MSWNSTLHAYYLAGRGYGGARKRAGMRGVMIAFPFMADSVTD